ncbi:hypothetical protein [Gordonia sp. NPDC058843]|uniref:hypothetical protein n=1 Tax=Gordonia sp. NPDC058843 TaxID=3346648 RepID=UPI0036937D96
MYANPHPHDATVLVPAHLRTAPHAHDLAGFTPIDPVIRPAGPDRPGLRASLVSWAANAVAWVAFVTTVVFFLLALGHAMAGEPADGYGVAALIAFGVAVLATIAACAALAVSFTQRIRHGALRRAGTIADAIVLSSVTAFTVLTALYPLAFVLAAW